MFYSETLLSKTGPLARVWLSANLERKLNKSNILQTNIENSVNAIVDQGQAPMALRLSGQLLLGVVRIYSRKARYLMDDCNEALLKIKLAFRPGNLDLDMATVNPEIAAPNTLMPDTLAGEIPGIPMLDESLFAGKPLDFNLGLPDTDPLNWTSQVTPTSPSIEVGRRAPEEQQSQLYEDDLGLEIDLGDEPSVEVGRRAELEKSFGADSFDDAGKLHDDDLGLDLGLDDEPSVIQPGVVPSVLLADQMDLDMPEESLLQQGIPPIEGDRRTRRDSLSPLSSTRSSVVREMDNTFLTHGSEEPVVIQARQPAAKRRKLLPVDAETEIKKTQIKQQQKDRSAILKPPSMLPRDPVLLALMEMQQKGLFVSSIMSDGRSKGWAPELRGILSIEVVRRNAGVKRKRKENDMPEQEQEQEQAELERSPTPQIVLPPEDDSAMPKPASVAGREESLAAPADDNEVVPAADENEPFEALVGHDTFDDTTMPLVHPEDQGPISQGTQHAVHLLRERFGGTQSSTEDSSTQSPASQRRQNAVLFQDMFPEATTSKADATKMFFEVLVLATKDAIKVDQPEEELGGPIKIRAKRGLYGAWAEERAGGEAFATQTEGVATQAVEI